MAEGDVSVRYGFADKSHENEFFRFFARSIKAYFEQKDIPACLLGMPECKVFDRLQIDALLITDRTITIIDFKDYSGTLMLPDEDSFQHGLWETAEGIPVKGGSSPNPFCQTGLQRERLKKVLKTFCKNQSSFNPNHISTMVCFSQSMQVIGRVPGKYRSFFHIADDSSFLEKLFDIVCAGRDDAGLMNPKFLDFFNEKIFATSEYDLSVTPDSLGISREEKASPRSIAESKTLQKEAEAFFGGDAPVMILTGTVGSGKREAVTLLRDAALMSGYSSARVFSLSNRVKRNLLSSMDDVESLYSAIYDFSASRIDEFGNQLIPLAKHENEIAFSDIDFEACTQRSVFIVYESQLVTDSPRMDEMVQFGSGKLLSDLLDYLGIFDENPENKVIFVGDKFQLGFGSWSDSSLNPDWYRGRLDIKTIDLPDSKDPTGIQSLCIELADAIRQKRTVNFQIPKNDDVVVCDSREEAELLQNVLSSRGKHKVLSYTNRQASGLNEYIKRRLLQNGSTYCPGDLVIFENQVVAYPSNVVLSGAGYVAQFDDKQPRRVENGEFGTLINVYDSPEETHVVNVKVSKEEMPVVLTLVRADVRLESSSIGEVVEIYFIKEVLESDEPRLTTSQEMALRIHLANILSTLMKEHPFESSRHYKEMIESGDYQITTEGLYRDKNDARFLTTYEKKHRSEIQNELLNRDSEYSRWMNAARIKYGWCMTVHKAMSYEFNEVTFSTKFEGGRRNESYFRFLYTGISRAKNRVNLVRWVPVSPFEKTEFGFSSHGGTKQKKKTLLIENCGDIAKAISEFAVPLLGEEMSLAWVKSTQYQEIFEISSGEAKAKAIFDYGKDGKVRLPRLANGDMNLFGRFIELLEQSASDSAKLDSGIDWLLDYLENVVLSGFELEVASSAAYENIVDFAAAGSKASVRVVYNKSNAITIFKLISGDEKIYLEIVKQIKKYYQLEE